MELHPLIASKTPFWVTFGLDCPKRRAVHVLSCARCGTQKVVDPH